MGWYQTESDGIRWGEIGRAWMGLDCMRWIWTRYNWLGRDGTRGDKIVLEFSRPQGITQTPEKWLSRTRSFYSAAIAGNNELLGP